MVGVKGCFFYITRMVLILSESSFDQKTNQMLRTLKSKNAKYNCNKRLEEMMKMVKYVENNELDNSKQPLLQSSKKTPV